MAKTPKSNSSDPAPMPLPQSGGCYEIIDGVLVARVDPQIVDDATAPDAAPETTPSTEA